MTMNVRTLAADRRRCELGAFLRSRREHLSPAAVGLPDGFRRRTPGLRREEVAMLADVGTTWYTWLEQGRDVRASEEVLIAIADALRLDAVERRHLFVLSDRPSPEVRSTNPEKLEEPVQRMLASLSGQPAYVTGRRWDILGWNRAATLVFGDYGQLSADERNLMFMVFANARHRRLLVDWQEVARASLAMFRNDSARYVGDPDFERLISTLRHRSNEFNAWWRRHEVLNPLSNIKRIRHPRKGLMVFEYTSFALLDGSDRKLTVYTPLDECRTADKLDALIASVRREP
ncbi:helix-turn-helix transcriptional regulator [Paraburkholderia atlantica]|uniref:Helix-turn-helix domain protein n=1 Tax=Paraburkholderia atlantica TaxID=2654982 RepID=D5W7G2_PARAM|nr:helix-turn-helix transcriptional regulator [Paraburkholderia atlantica]ADG15357.1 helix-turn-helix domain protein [Paraburkholderia atlantica]MBB5504144.1 transcriptional regulator with XRE-family HTH domain [Paraburkholderia atlantica]